MKTGKQFAILSIIILASGLSLCAQPALQSDTTELKKVFTGRIREWIEAYNSKDAQKLIPLYTVDAIYSSSHVNGLEATGRDRVAANFQVGMSGGGHIDKIEILRMNVSCDLASLYCKYQATNSGVTVVGRNLLVLKKVKGKWLIVNHMTVV
jgi:ketosteroid isomerase-like protein